MGKKNFPPPGVVDELFTRIEELEARTRALEDAARAFAVVFAIPRIPDTSGDGEEHESTSRGE